MTEKSKPLAVELEGLMKLTKKISKKWQGNKKVQKSCEALLHEIYKCHAIAGLLQELPASKCSKIKI